MLGTFIAIFLFALFYAFWALGTVVVTRGKHARQRELAEVGYLGAKNALHILAEARRYLLICQIWRFFSAFFTGFFSFQLIFRLLPDSHDELYFYYQQLLIVALVVFAIGAISLSMVQLAKALAYSKPTRTLCSCSFAIIFFGKVVFPLVWMLSLLVDGVLKKVGIGLPAERELAVTPEELNEMVDRSFRGGEIDEDEKNMIQHVLTFSETVVREVMTPRSDIISVEEGTSLENLRHILDHEKVSRVLVTGSNLDDVKGVVLLKDLVRYAGQSVSNFSIKDIMRPAFFVANSKHVDELLKEFRREGAHYAVVFDEHGGVDGVVTAEDLFEEIVGDIFDEHDSPLEEIDSFRTRSGDLLVDGSMIVDDLNAEHKLNIPRGEYDTIAGFVINMMGRIPAPGDIVDYRELRFRVEEMEQNRVTQIRISQIPPIA